MDIQARKLNLIQWLVNLTDEAVLQEVESLHQKDVDFWEELSLDQQREIYQGISELEEGKKSEYFIQ